MWPFYLAGNDCSESAFKLIILINQYDGWSDSEFWKDGIKIELIIVSNGTHISVGRSISTILNGVHLKDWRMIWSFHPANVYKGDHVMRNNIINSVSIILAMALPFMLAPNAFGQNMESDSYQQGYGSYDTMDTARIWWDTVFMKKGCRADPTSIRDITTI